MKSRILEFTAIGFTAFLIVCGCTTAQRAAWNAGSELHDARKELKEAQRSGNSEAIAKGEERLRRAETNSAPYGWSNVWNSAAQSKPKPTPADEVFSKSKVTRDDFKKFIEVEGPIVRFHSFDSYQFSAEKRDSGTHVNYFLNVGTSRSSYEGWAFWKEIYDANGNKLSNAGNSRDVGRDAWTHELLTVHITREQLDQMINAPARFKVYGERASQEFSIAPTVVAGFLRKCDQTFEVTNSLTKQ